ncbi:MAG: hypothetical protein JXA45_05050, partial [Methanomassiliicoccales archaeon]|nr:hypothetical protein [Methanomassiliicoccales archaeon]
SVTSIRISTFDGWQRSSFYRDTKKMSGIREALVRMGASINESQVNRAQSQSHLPPAASVTPSTDRKNHCDLCGERIVPGASFCSRCGRRL